MFKVVKILTVENVKKSLKCRIEETWIFLYIIGCDEVRCKPIIFNIYFHKYVCRIFKKTNGVELFSFCSTYKEGHYDMTQS